MTHPAKAFAVAPERCPALLAAVLADSPFITLITAVHGEMRIEHLPVLLTADGKALCGHLAAGNALIRALRPRGVEAHGPHGSQWPYTAVVHGPQHYISPNWYASKSGNPNVVPTWNYVSLDVRGTLRLRPEPDWLEAQLRQMTDVFEARVGEDWALDDAPAEYRAGLYRGIVGVELQIESLGATCKASQKKSQPDQASVLAALERVAPATAAAFVRAQVAL